MSTRDWTNIFLLLRSSLFIQALTVFNARSVHTCTSRRRAAAAAIRQDHHDFHHLTAPTTNEPPFWTCDFWTEQQVIRHVIRSVYEMKDEDDTSNLEHLIHVVDAHLPLIVMDQFLSQEMCLAILHFSRNHLSMSPSLMGGVSPQNSLNRTSSTLARFLA